jgi:ubiquinone/menaquinone biosynthesis C-methylase UbiE
MKEKKAKDFDFSKRAEAYDAGFEGRLVKRFYDLLYNEITMTPDMRLLDVGCGTGALLKRLCEKFDITADGIDADENMIAVAKRQCPSCSFQIAPCESLPFPDHTFDTLTACLAYHHFRDKEGFAREAARVLKPGGTLYIADPNFPFVIRKSINGAARLFRVVGEFLTAREIADRFQEYGFEFTGSAHKGYAQVVKLTRIGRDT